MYPRRVELGGWIKDRLYSIDCRLMGYNDLTTYSPFDDSDSIVDETLYGE